MSARWGIVVLWAVVLASGCASPAARYAQQRDTGNAGWGVEATAEDGDFEPQRPQQLYRRKAERHSTDLTWDQAAPLTEAEGRLGSGNSVAVPEDWPDYEASEEQLLAPLLACTSPAEFLALQRQVDMARLLRAVGDWSAVRLSALGPLVSPEAVQVLLRKRASFLLQSTEHYGHAHAEVFILFLLHSAFDDEVAALLRLLAADKQLSQTLGPMAMVRRELELRGLRLESFPERGEQPKDVLRGLGRAARDALSTSEARAGALGAQLSIQRGHLPPVYQRALDEVERGRMLHHYAPASVTAGSFDVMTFGVPLGFYHLIPRARGLPP